MSAQPHISVSHTTILRATLHSERQAPSELTVLSFSGAEAINEPHVFEIKVRCDSEQGARTLQEEILIGRGTMLTI